MRAMATMNVLINEWSCVFLEINDLKIPATGNPCVLTAG
jgi:hypothetical protein